MSELKLTPISETEFYPMFSIEQDGYIEFHANLKQKNIDRINRIMKDFELLQDRLIRLRSMKSEY